PSPGRGGSSTHRADTGMVWQDLASELLFLPQTRSRNNREQLHFHAPGNDMDDDDATSFQERDAGHSGRRTAPGKRSGTSAAVQESARREHFSQHRGLQSGAATDAGGSGPPPCPAKLRATPRDPVGERIAGSPVSVGWQLDPAHAYPGVAQSLSDGGKSAWRVALACNARRGDASRGDGAGDRPAVRSDVWRGSSERTGAGRTFDR